MLDTAAIEECILGTRTQWRVVDRQPYLAKKIAFLLTTKATLFVPYYFLIRNFV